VTIVEYLLEIKADINSKDRFGGTPLEDAVRHNFEVRNAKQVVCLRCISFYSMYRLEFLGLDIFK